MVAAAPATVLDVEAEVSKHRLSNTLPATFRGKVKGQAHGCTGCGWITGGDTRQAVLNHAQHRTDVRAETLKENRVTEALIEDGWYD